MLTEIKQGMLFTVMTMALFGGAYHAVLWGIGRVAFPAQAEGSLLRHPDGRVIGSRLIAQNFTRPDYFHPRPSAVDYDAAATGGSNHGPSNPDHLADVEKRLRKLMEEERLPAHQIPAEMVTASGAGLDPHLSPAAAALQAQRVAASRAIDVVRVLDLVGTHTESRGLGFLGRPRVNVLQLNLALDQAFGTPSSKP